MLRALTIAATGMNAQQLHVEVIANNLANINTTGFKRGRAEFADLLYQADRSPGANSRSQDSVAPEGVEVGLGTRSAGIRSLQTQGALNATGNSLDLALSGRGWFQITAPDGDTVYTRAGAFNTNSTGQLVTLDGYPLSPNITVPPGASNVTVSESGNVSVLLPGQTAPQTLGQLTLASFINEAGLDPQGGNLFKQTVASGQPTVGIAGEAGLGVIKQGYLENSNVDPVKEITELITAQRAYEMNSKVIQAVDEMAASVSKGLR